MFLAAIKLIKVYTLGQCTWVRGGSLSTRIVGQNLIKAQYKRKVPQKSWKNSLCSDIVYSFRTNQFKINLRMKNFWWKLYFLRIFCPNSYALLAVVRMVTKAMFAGKSIPNTYLKVYYKQRRYWTTYIPMC